MRQVEIRANGVHQADLDENMFIREMQERFGDDEDLTLEEYVALANEHVLARAMGVVVTILE